MKSDLTIVDLNSLWIFLPIVFLLSVFLPVIWMRTSERRKRGDLFVKSPEDARFVERWVSGVLKHEWARARNCLMVAITDDRLVVRCHYPFSIFVSTYDLDICIKNIHLLRCDEVYLFMGRGSTVVFFDELSQKEKEITFFLRQPDKFRAVLADLLG